MTVFYHGPCARITQEVFEMRGPNVQSFFISELVGIHVVKQGRPSVMGSLWARLSSTALVFVAIVAGVAAWRENRTSEIALTALLVILVSTAVSAGCWRSRDNPYELRALYRGKPVCLLRTPDQRMLGQVCRGLQRARERNEAAI